MAQVQSDLQSLAGWMEHVWCLPVNHTPIKGTIPCIKLATIRLAVVDHMRGEEDVPLLYQCIADS